MNYLSADSISLSFGEKILFQNLTFGISQGEKIALVGINGCGKSSLLKILAKKEPPDNGQVIINKNIHVAYLAQQPNFKSENIIEAVLEGKPKLASLIDKYEYHQRRISSPNSKKIISDLIYEMEEQNAWTYEAQIKEILNRLGINDFEKKISSMSGGEQKRIGLAKTLLEKPDLIILDEPTNHLDIEAIEWLEKYLKTSNMTIIMVTHDRHFLDTVTNKIIELDRGKIYSYSGDYHYFLEKQSERKQLAINEHEKIKNIYKKELEWIRKQPKARSSKSKFRVDEFEKIKSQKNQKITSQEIKIDFEKKRQGGKIVEIKNISKNYDDQPIIQNFSYTFKKKDRIGIVGKNGSGKSTFLELITHRIEPDSGKIELGKSTQIGYYVQKEPIFDLGMKVIEVLTEIASVFRMGKQELNASQLLTLFNFPITKQYDEVNKLSGGEKRRLQLLKVIIKQPNFLILDEPTNDLDLVTIDILEDFLSQFDGCLIIVSHDKYFMNRLVDQLFILKKNEPITIFNGNYETYRANECNIDKKSLRKDVQKKIKANNSEKKLSYKEKRELEQIEIDLKIINSKKNNLENRLLSGETNHKKLSDWGKELDLLNLEQNKKELRWIELSEIEE